VCDPGDVTRVPRFIGLRRASWQLGSELFLAVRHLYGLGRARLLVDEYPLRLNLGSFTDVRPGWVSVDPFVLWGGTLPLDLREPLPFPDDSAELIHAEHFLEHVSPGDALRLLRECRRLLRPGGLLSLAVPDAGLQLEAYARRDVGFFEAEALPRTEVPTLLGHLNYLFRGGGLHLYAYDWDTLGFLVAAAGFDSMERRAYDPELDLRDDDLTLRVSARA
jgi:predicted SAM-dependent methyltransferase